MSNKNQVFIFLVFAFLFLAAAIGATQEKDAEEEAVGKQVNAILNDAVLKGAEVGIYVKSLATGKVICRRDSDKLFIPASTNKLITGAAALETLGTKYKFKTEVYTDGPVSPDGTVHGNLYIKGYGDPSLVVEEAWLLAHEIRGYGVRTVKGDIIGDETFFEPVRFYDWGFKSPSAYSAPMGALSFNWNTLQAYVAPGNGDGSPAHVTLNPETDYYTLQNDVQTCVGCKTILSMRLDGRQAIVSGKIDSNSEPWTSFAMVTDPATVAVHAVKKLLEKEDVQIEGGTTVGAVPQSAKLLFRHQSREMSLIIRYLYRFSNNFTAEQIQKTMGAEVFQGPATREKGCQAALDYLKKIDAYQPGVVVDDGSGLSRKNRQSPISMVKTLVHVANTPEIYPEFLEALAIGGVDGTLARRFKKTPLEKRIRAKTGYLYGAITLAGYSWNTAGEPFAFAIFVNNPPPKSGAGAVRKKIDEILVALMR
jgi:serine-type D-Ala-D-Ala carboxypeptidase/endopeptidase (penicillin-binding protein 4)